MNDTQQLIGKLVPVDITERDAIHIAVVPVVAGERLSPGMPVRRDSRHDVFVRGAAVDHVGVVDPFLTEALFPGDRFWLFLLPNTITSLKHNWTHPEFLDESPPLATPKFVAEMWLRNFCEDNNTEYEALIQDIQRGNEFCFGNETNLNNDAALEKKFWGCVELVIGRKVDNSDRPDYYRCAC